ncbi:MAG: glycosyltransferase family 4 protein [Bacteroidales bacterium]|jgi:glycosyltransferase involved in cell wall biosynthesis|nr:glycosyltransferase family 4 protein [Bacteroidales bacterium]
MRKRVAIVNQRYGIEINGGSEQHTRQLAERLISYYEVEVLTTCALEYITWENFFPEGLQSINRVSVRRFPVDKPRDIKHFNETTERLLKSNSVTEDAWVDEQGPLCTALIKYIWEQKDKYDVFIFVTYLYYLTVRGINIVKDKAILIPTAHDEFPIYFSIYKQVFTIPRAIAFNTKEEQNFIYSLFHNEYIPSDILGVGIEIPDRINPGIVKRKYNIKEYIVYVGRIDESKGCLELFAQFIRYKKENPSNLKLLLIGKSVMEIPRHSDILSIGFVIEEEKYNVMASAKMLVLPSLYESLSIVTLESLALGIPVILNGNCEVLVGHCRKSNAGLYYKNYYEFAAAINYLLSHQKEYTTMQLNGNKYVKENYTWDIILNKLRKLIDLV